MARGRKPIPRSKEEALNVRREQIRRNVKAFRDRKRKGKGQMSQDTNSELPTFRIRGDGLIGQGKHSDERTDTSTTLIITPGIGALLSCLWRQPNSALAIEQGIPQGASSSIHANDDLANDHRRSVTRQSTYSELPMSGHGFQSTLPARTKNSVLLLLEINSAQVSQRQFVVNTSTLFIPETEFQRNQAGDLGPHWAARISVCVATTCIIMDQSLQAVCLLQLAHLNLSRDFLMISRYYYTQALQKLRLLSHSPETYWRELFICTMILGVYETFDGTGDRHAGMRCHLQGATTYLRKFTQFDESLTDNFYYNYLEMACIHNALRERKASPLSTSMWWSCTIDMYAGKTYGHLLRLITPLPALLERFDYLKGSPSNLGTQSAKSTLLDECFALEDRFKDWFEETLHLVEDFEFDDAGDSAIVYNLPRPRRSDVQYSFPNLWIARLYSLYWTSVILLAETMSALFRDLFKQPAHTMSDSVTWALGDAVVLHDMMAQAKLFATNIRRSVPFCLRPCTGLLGRSIILLPLQVAAKHFQQADEEQARWCSAVLSRMGQNDCYVET